MYICLQLSWLEILQQVCQTCNCAYINSWAQCCVFLVVSVSEKKSRQCSLLLPSDMYLCWGYEDSHRGLMLVFAVLSGCWDFEMYFVQEPCSPSSEKHDAGLRKQSAPIVQHVIQSNNSIVIQPHADDRKTEKGWAQFEEDTQGLHSICSHSVFSSQCLQYHQYSTVPAMWHCHHAI